MRRRNYQYEALEIILALGVIGCSIALFFKARELTVLFQRICKENGILSSPEDCFRFMDDLPEKYPQMSIFDL